MSAAPAWRPQLREPVASIELNLLQRPAQLGPALLAPLLLVSIRYSPA